MKRFLIISVILLFHSLLYAHNIKLCTARASVSSKEIAVTLRIFADDLERVLNYSLNTTNAFSSSHPPAFRPDFLLILQTYTKENFKMAVNQRPINLKLSKVEWAENTYNSDNPVVLIYLVDDGIKAKPEKVTITNSFLFLIPDQTNMLTLAIENTEDKIMKFEKGHETEQVFY